MATGRSLRLGESVLAAGVLALGTFIAVQTAQMQVSAVHAAVGPRLFPSLIAAGLLLVGAFLLREAFAGHIAHEKGMELDWFAFALVCAGLIVEMLLMERAGWIIAATVLFVLVARAFKSRKIVIDIALGLGLSVLTFVVFSYGLDLSLPGGFVAEMMQPADEDAAP